MNVYEVCECVGVSESLESLCNTSVPLKKSLPAKMLKLPLNTYINGSHQQTHKHAHTKTSEVTCLQKSLHTVQQFGDSKTFFFLKEITFIQQVCITLIKIYFG